MLAFDFVFYCRYNPHEAPGLRSVLFGSVADESVCPSNASSGLAGADPDSRENDGQRITVQSIAAVSKRSGHRSNPG